MQNSLLLKLTTLVGLGLSALTINFANAYTMPGISDFEVPNGFHLVQIKQTLHKQEHIVAGKSLENIDPNKLDSYFPYKLKDYSKCSNSFIFDDNDKCGDFNDLESSIVFTNSNDTARLELFTAGTGKIPPFLNNLTGLIFSNGYIKGLILDLFQQELEDNSFGDIASTEFTKLTDIRTGNLNGERVVILIGKNDIPKYKNYPNVYIMFKFNSNNFSYIKSYAQTPELANQNLVYLLNHLKYTR